MNIFLIFFKNILTSNCFMGFLNKYFIGIRLNMRNIDLDTQIDYHKPIVNYHRYRR